MKIMLLSASSLTELETQINSRLTNLAADGLGIDDVQVTTFALHGGRVGAQVLCAWDGQTITQVRPNYTSIARSDHREVIDFERIRAKLFGAKPA